MFCFAHECQARGIKRKHLLHSSFLCMYTISSCFEAHTFLSRDSSLFYLYQSLPYEVVTLGLNSQGKEKLQTHMILILNACPIFKHLTSYHHFKNDTSPPPPLAIKNLPPLGT